MAIHRAGEDDPAPAGDRNIGAADGDIYTHGHHPSVIRSHRWRTVDNSAGYLVPYLRPGVSVLDVGCGPGSITVDMARRVRPGQVVGIDRAPTVIEQARAQHPAELPDLQFMVNDCYRLSFPSACFDVVHAHQVLQHLSDPVAALVEMKRVVKRDGVVAVRDADYGGMFWAPEIDGLERWRQVYRTVARANRAEPDAARHLVSWARSAGFGTIEPSADTWCFATEQDRAWWGGLWADRIVSSSLAHQAVGYGVAQRDELEQLARAWRSWAADPDGWFVVVNGQLLLRP